MPSVADEINSVLCCLRVVPVVVLDHWQDAIPLASALRQGGLPLAEITMRTPSALRAIELMSRQDDICVGAGSVHSFEQARQATEAGAKFVVSPGFNSKMVQWCLERRVSVIPGVSNATDLEMALDLGVTLVKFFPAEPLGGVSMLKALAGPYGELRFMPTGGIDISNILHYLEVSAVVACGGTWMVKPDLIASGRFDEISRLANDVVSLVRTA